jgi:16S rRNA (adenine(1408)-N(1))-methyltransferase
VLDLGTGDGNAVLRAARQSSDTFLIGVDANAAGLADASRRAARKNGVPNALFIVGDASDVLIRLRGQLAEVRVTLPWGSLLRAIVGGERDFALAVAGSL